MADTVADRPRLLVAEDDPTLAALMRDILEDDFSVDVAGDGSQAVKLAHSGHPDVMVMDAGMPHMDGFAACRALRGDPSTADLPIIMVTGSSAPETAAAAFDAGATDYLSKPFSVSQLRSRARMLLLRRLAS
jgi:DNA-binding response OmpR family regulator